MCGGEVKVIIADRDSHLEMPNTYSTLENDAVAGSAMIPEVAQKDIGDCADDAVRGQVILVKTHDSVSRLFDVDLPTRVVVPEGR